MCLGDNLRILQGNLVVQGDFWGSPGDFWGPPGGILRSLGGFSGFPGRLLGLLWGLLDVGTCVVLRRTFGVLRGSFRVFQAYLKRTYEKLDNVCINNGQLRLRTWIWKMKINFVLCPCLAVKKTTKTGLDISNDHIMCWLMTVLTPKLEPIIYNHYLLHTEEC